MFGLLGRATSCLQVLSSARLCVVLGPRTHLCKRIQHANAFIAVRHRYSDSGTRGLSTIQNSAKDSDADLQESISESEKVEGTDIVSDVNTEDTMAQFGNNYVLLKVPEDGDKVNIAVHWSGRVVNLDRQKSETLKTVITRLKRSLAKPPPRVHLHVQDMKHPYDLCYANYVCWNKETCSHNKQSAGESSQDTTVKSDHKEVKRPDKPMDNEFTISFMSEMFHPFEESATLESIAEEVSFLSINGAILQIYKNIFRLLGVVTSNKIMIGCPALFNIRSDGPWRHRDINFQWISEDKKLLSNRHIFVPSQSMEGKRVKLRLSHKQLTWNVVESPFCEVSNGPKNRWQEHRITKFNAGIVKRITSPLQSDLRDLRIMSFNILSPTYVATEEAMERFFPYCDPRWLDSSYRCPMIVREIIWIQPQVLCLQECSSGTYRDYLEPFLADSYNSWLTIKSASSDEGCCLFVHKHVFDIKDVKSVIFKDEIKKPEYAEILQRIGAEKWLNYDIETYFSRYHTVFQMGCFKNILDSKDNYLFVVNTHLYFHPQGRHIRLLQTLVMLTELEKFKKKCAEKYGFDLERTSSTIICGDFNSFRSEGVFQLMSSGWVQPDHPDFECGLTHTHEKFNPSEHPRSPDEISETMRYTDKPNFLVQAANCKGYVDAYQGVEPPFTNYVKTFYGTLDYIFHSKNIRPKRCMPGISLEDAMEYQGLPSEIYPSDHISIAADF